ncbi:MAG: hypothetical protein QM780_07865 [Hyphomicrobium sp.]|uniref:hypothetical protein n=1 Tax=Hyphomicrobium sp. TaxID=82 RepID=UPI0039E5D39C
MRKEVEKMQSSINAEVMQAKGTIDDAGKAASLEPPKSPPPAASIEPQTTTESAPVPSPTPEPAKPEAHPAPAKTES